MKLVPDLPVCTRCAKGDHGRCRIMDCWCEPCEAPHREPQREKVRR